MLSQHRLGFTHCGQVVDAVPLADEGQVLQKMIDRGFRQIQGQIPQASPQVGSQHGTVGVGHVQAASSVAFACEAWNPWMRFFLR